MSRRRRTFRLQFLAQPSERGIMVLDERKILARDLDGAIKEAVALPQRPGVRSLRLVDLDGREIFERLYADFQ
jgi:hypothetical protein